MRANLETLRTRVREVEGLHDARGLREGQEALSTRISEIEECITVHHVREYMRRIILIERIGNSGGVIGETLRQCQVRLDQYAASLTDLRERMRTQDWYHDLPEQESDDEIQQTLGRAETEHDNDAENRPVNRNRRRNRLIAQQRRVARAMSGVAPRVLREMEIGQTITRRFPATRFTRRCFPTKT